MSCPVSPRQRGRQAGLSPIVQRSTLRLTGEKSHRVSGNTEMPSRDGPLGALCLLKSGRQGWSDSQMPGPFSCSNLTLAAKVSPEWAGCPAEAVAGDLGCWWLLGLSRAGRRLPRCPMSVGLGREAAFRSFLEQWIEGHPGAAAQWLPNLDARLSS